MKRADCCALTLSQQVAARRPRTQAIPWLRVVPGLAKSGKTVNDSGDSYGTTRTAVRDIARKEGRYPELVGPRARSRLVVFGVEVGGRWSGESQTFISQLARARARGEQPILLRRAEQAWRIRWGSMVSCVVARAVASSLLGLPRALGADGDTPLLHDVERDLLAAGFVV